MKSLPLAVKLCERNEIKSFVEHWHYSHSINGVKSLYCFKLTLWNTIIGAIIHAPFAMAGVWKKYTNSREKVIELRRLCCIDDTPQNMESFFISRTLKWLRDNTDIEIVISYADDYYGHTGIVYHASNFEYLGTTCPTKMIEWNGRRWHDKTIRTKYKGKLKPYAKRLRDALQRGDAHYTQASFKHIFKYNLRRRKPKYNHLLRTPESLLRKDTKRI